MNGTLTTTMIGITGGGMITLLAVFIRMMISRFERLEDKFERLENKLERLAIKVDNNTAAIKDLEIKLTDKFTSQLKEHSERLARIEAIRN
ncbi:MAG: hypothetical protein F4138_06600 [Acidimicrobiia bacterium]|nr:hypothetical protein [Acidimicrobiia bacterium]MYC57952.1 hypothetical protein [Acidimicrobiia bacterium]MYG94640.1 hypothetical protein [Acidimicrobiia bacterium]MYI31099.1 hypothetical protein [Acidimicrobiia bacterium]